MCATAHAQADPGDTGLRASRSCKKPWLCALNKGIFFGKQGGSNGVKYKPYDATHLQNGAVTKQNTPRVNKVRELIPRS